MKDTSVTNGQWKRLHELDDELVGAGLVGLSARVQAVIRSAEESMHWPVAKELTRRKQAKKLFDMFKGCLPTMNFEAYLKSVPLIPESLCGRQDIFPCLALIDPRIPVKALADAVRADFRIGAEGHHSKAKIRKPYWLAYRLSLNEYHDDIHLRSGYTWQPEERGLTVHEGLTAFNLDRSFLLKSSKEADEGVLLPESLQYFAVASPRIMAIVTWDIGKNGVARSSTFVTDIERPSRKPHYTMATGMIA